MNAQAGSKNRPSRKLGDRAVNSSTKRQWPSAEAHASMPLRLAVSESRTGTSLVPPTRSARASGAAPGPGPGLLLLTSRRGPVPSGWQQAQVELAAASGAKKLELEPRRFPSSSESQAGIWGRGQRAAFKFQWPLAPRLPTATGSGAPPAGLASGSASGTFRLTRSVRPAHGPRRAPGATVH